MKRLRNVCSGTFLAWFASVILASAIPFMMGGYLTSVVILILIWIIMAISLNLVYGFTGLLSLAHSAFLGIGGYSFALLTVQAGFGFWPAFFLSIAIVGLAGIIIGFPALRLRGPYFILVTISFAIIVQVLVVAWVGLTGGTNGMVGIPRPPQIPMPFGTEISFEPLESIYFFTLFFLILISLINYRLVNSLVGRTFIAISQDEDLSQSLGVNTVAAKLLSFVISAMFAGVAGVLYATYNSVVSPDLANAMNGFTAFVFVVIGGVSTMAGPFIGSLIMMALPELLQAVAGLKTLFYGVILLCFTMFMPSGIVGLFRLLTPFFTQTVAKKLNGSR